MKKESLNMYILVNQDAKIQRGKLASHVGHAVASYIHKIYKDENKSQIEILDKYMNSLQKKILLEAPKIFIEALDKSGRISIRDEELMMVDPNSLICVNLGIIDYNNIPEEFEFLKSLNLVE